MSNRRKDSVARLMRGKYKRCVEEEEVVVRSRWEEGKVEAGARFCSPEFLVVVRDGEVRER